MTDGSAGSTLGLAMAGGREILFEFLRVGAYVKVIAVDAATGIEVTTVGAVGASELILKRTAMNKLLYVLRKQGKLST